MNVFLNVFLNRIIIITESMSLLITVCDVICLLTGNTKTSNGGPLYVVLLMHASPHNLFLNSASNVTLL